MERSIREVPETPVEPLRFGVIVDENNHICLHFSKAVIFFGLPPQEAASLGALLIKHAQAAAEITGTVLEAAT